MQKKILVLLLSVFLVLSCGGKQQQSNSDVVEVTFWHAMGGPLGDVLQSMIDDFNTQHPKINVKSIHMGNYNALSQKVMAGVQAGEPPVMAQAYESWTAQLIEGEVVRPMEEFFAGPNGLSDESLGDMIDVLISNNTWGDKVWSFPFNKSVPVFYYNKKMFEENGITEPPKTWEEFRSVCEKLTKDEDGDGTPEVYGTAFPLSAWAFECLLLQNGGEILDENGKAAFNSPEGVEALEYLKGLLDDDLAYLTSGYEHQNDFLAGKVGIVQGTIVSIGFMKPKLAFEMGVAPLPEKKEKGIILSGTNVIVFSKSSVEQQNAAWKFIKWFTSSESSARWAAGTYYLPVRKSSLASPIMEEIYQQYDGLKEAAAQVRYAEFEPPTQQWFEGRKFLQEDALENALRGNTSVKEALDIAAKKYNASLEE